MGFTLQDVGVTVPLDEVARTVALLARDHSSHIGAAANGWRYPATSEALAVMDLFDVFMRANFKNPRPYPRPWDKPTRIGSTTLSPDEAVALLNRAKTGTL